VNAVVSLQIQHYCILAVFLKWSLQPNKR
jgi:hypothetical protein